MYEIGTLRMYRAYLLSNFECVDIFIINVQSLNIDAEENVFCPEFKEFL